MLLVKIVNKTGNPKISSYEWEAYVNTTIIAKGKVTDFKRKRGWRALLREVARSEDILYIQPSILEEYIKEEKAWSEK